MGGRFRGRRLPLTALAAALVFLSAGCGLGLTPSPSPSPSADAARILGHPATGVARSVLDKRVLVVGIDSDYPPQSSVDPKTHEPVGFNVDVAKAIASRLGVRVAWKYLSPDSTPAALAAHKIDLAVDSTPDTPEDRKLMALSDPYCSTLGQLFVAKGGAPVTSADSLAGRTVGVAAATVFYDYLLTSTKATAAMYADDRSALAALLDGKVDYWMTAAQTGRAAAGSAIAAAGPPLMSEALVCAGRHGEKDLLALVDAALTGMRSSGQLSALSKRWYGMDLTVAR